MCFVLYVGTTNPLPRRKSDKDSVDLPVESLTERDSAVIRHFSKAEVQYVGSTSGCGCDFPHASLQNGEWPELEYFSDAKRKRWKLRGTFRTAIIARLWWLCCERPATRWSNYMEFGMGTLRMRRRPRKTCPLMTYLAQIFVSKSKVSSGCS